MLETFALADDARDGRAEGATSMAAGLAYRYRLDHKTARDWVRVAHALADLPLVRAAFAAGDVSFDQLVFVSRFATPSDDEWLAERLPALRAAPGQAMAAGRRPRQKNRYGHTPDRGRSLVRQPADS